MHVSMRSFFCLLREELRLVQGGMAMRRWLRGGREQREGPALSP
jgi:hypothetical protein